MFRAIINKYRKLLLSILLVSAVGCASMTGLASSYLSLERSLRHYIRDYGYPDGVIRTAVTTRDKADLLRTLPGISEVNTRLLGDTVMISPSGRYLSVRAISYSDGDFQQFHYWQKTDPGEKDAILLEYIFADDNGISAGDIVTVRVGGEYRDYPVAGIVSMPETLAALPAQTVWGANSDFGYFYVPLSLLEREENPEYIQSKEAIEDKAAELEEKRQELDSSRKRLLERQAELEQAEAALREKQTGLDTGIAEAEAQQAQLDDAAEQIAAAEKEPDAPDALLKIRQAELDAASALLKIRQAELKAGIAEAEARQAQLDAAAEQIAAGEKELDAAAALLKEKQAELEAATAELEEWEGYQVFCNEFLLRFTPGADREAALEEAIRILKEEVPEIQNSFLYENSVLKNRIDSVLLPVNTLTILLPAVFFAVVMTVGFLFTSLIVRQSRREIGILRALGFSAGDIRLLFCKVNLPVSLGAIILGTLISIGIARYIGSEFESFFPLPFYENVFDTGNAVFSALLTVVVGQAATLSGTSLISRIQPSEAMSKQPPSSGKLSGFGRWLTRKAGPFTRYSIISLLRNKKRFIFSVFCLSASVMIIFASLSFIASKNAILTELFEIQIHYDCQVFLKDAPDKVFTEELEALDYVSGILQTDCYTSDISFQGHTETASVNALPEDTDMIRIFGTKNEPLSVPSEGILLEKHLAAELGAVPGDFVLVDGVRMEVAGISNQNVNRSQYISARQAEKLGEPAIRTILIRTEETDETAAVEGEHSVQALLAGRDDYLHCVFTRLFRNGTEKGFAFYDLAAWIIIGFAVLIGLIIVVNTMQTNLLEQKKELCVLRTLGFSHRFVSAKLFLQSLLYFVFSCIIGTPLGAVFAVTALRQLATKETEYPFASGIAECLLTAGLLFGCIVLSHLISSRSMKKWNIVEIVKEKE